MIGRDKVHDSSGMEFEDGCKSCFAFGEYDVDLLGAVGEGGDLFNERVRVRRFIGVMFVDDGVSKVE